MKILYVALKYDYGQPDRGHSFEHHNFYETLVKMGHTVLYFDFFTLMQQRGREWMNRRLLEIAEVEEPNLMFTVLFKNELDPAIVRQISEETETVTINWFCDDHWRFDTFSSAWAQSFNWVATTAESALPKYRQLGYANVIKSQWACNHFSYEKLDLPIAYDVTFVGQPHGNRRLVIEAVRKAGINVKVWGNGWESGRLSQTDMVRVFNQSRINLNLSNASVTGSAPRSDEAGYPRWLSQAVTMMPFGSKLKALGKRGLSGARNIRAAGRTISPAPEYLDQIKGRNFEVPGCAGFVLTGKAENLEEYYRIGEEVVCFENTDDLIDKIRYFLDHEDERGAIAQAGYERTLKEHTYEKRFENIFQQIGLVPERQLNDIAATLERGGQVVEIN